MLITQSTSQTPHLQEPHVSAHFSRYPKEWSTKVSALKAKNIRSYSLMKINDTLALCSDNTENKLTTGALNKWS